MFDASADPFLAAVADQAFASARATALGQAEATVHSIAVDGCKPRDLAFLLLSKASSRALASGNHHVYRGVLSGEGKGYLTVYRRSVEELARSGFITRQEADADLAAIQGQIKQAG